MAGLDRTYVSSCEAGRRNATLKTVERLAVALGVDPALLVSDHCGELPPPSNKRIERPPRAVD